MKGSSTTGKSLLNYRKIILGVLNAYLMTLLLFLCLGGLLYFTELSEALVPSAVMAISALSIIFCGIKITRDVENLGWLHGGFIGLIYVALLLVVGVVTGISSLQGWSPLMDLMAGFLAGAISGILGVNL